MDLKGFTDWTGLSAQRHVRVIGEWAATVKPDLTTKGQWDVFLRRNLRAAREVAPFTDSQIEAAFSRMVEMVKSKKFTPTLETLVKFLTNHS
jgi:hypothetical protein